MSVDKFNSVGGFSVGIPPKPIIDAGGNITALSANIVGNITADTITSFAANVTHLTAVDIHAGDIYGTIHSNVIAGDLQVDAADTQVVFSEERIEDGKTVRIARGSSDFTFNVADYDYSQPEPRLVTSAKLNLSGDLNVTKVNIGTVNTGKVAHEAIAAKTFDGTPQVIHNIQSAISVEAVEYTIIATRTVNDIQTERHTCKIVASVLGDNIRYYEYGTAVNGGIVGDFEMKLYDAGIGGKFIQLQVTPAYSSGQVDYKIFSTIYKG